MRYTGEICPYCGVAFNEGDDVVVCPECATPHHRGCWFAHGCCANAEKHAEGFVWSKQNAQPEPAAVQHSEQSGEIVCPDCGKVCPNGTLRCPDCGALLLNFNQFNRSESGEAQQPQFAFFRPGFDPNEQVGSAKSGDIALYCRTSAARYIQIFKNIASGKKVSFNWASFLFAPYWFFYRKLYKPGIIFLALFMALNLWQLPLMNEFYEVYDSAVIEAQRVTEAQGEKAANAVLEQRAQQLVEAATPLMLPMMLYFVLKLCAGFLANKFYYKKVMADIEQINSEPLEQNLRQASIFKKGGASLALGALSALVCDGLITLATYILNG